MVDVVFAPGEKSCVVIVPDHQLSLAIGKKGQNVRLAAKLTGYKIDIKSETTYAAFVAEQEAAEEALLHVATDEESQAIEADTTPDYLDETSATTEVE